MALVRLSSFLQPLFAGRRFHIQKIVDPATTDGIEELGRKGYNEVRKLFDNKIIQSSDLTPFQKIFYDLNPKANYTTGMMIDDVHGPKIKRELTEIFRKYSTGDKLKEATPDTVSGTIRAVLQTDSPAAALAKREADKAGSFVIIGNRGNKANEAGEVYFSPKMLEKKFGENNLSIDEFMTQQARVRRQGGTAAARRGNIIDEETGELVKIYTGPELGKLLGVSKKKYTALFNNYYHKLGHTDISSKPATPRSAKATKVKEVLDDQSDLDIERIIKEYKEEVGLSGNVHLAHLLTKSPVTDYSSAQTLGTIGLMDKFSNQILYAPFDAVAKNIFNRQSALIKQIETGKFGKSNLNEARSKLLQLNKQAKELTRDTNGGVITREVIINNIGVPGATKFRTIGKKQTPFSFKNRIEQIYNDNPLYDVPENQIDIVEQALPDLLIKVQAETVQNIRNMAPILARNKSLYQSIKSAAEREGIKLPKEFKDLEKKVGSFDLASYGEVKPLGLAEGGSTGIQPVASPTQEFDKQVKQMMETSGLDFADSIIEVMKDTAKRQKFNLGGMVGNDYGGFAYDEESSRNKVGALESLLAGIGSGLIDIPKGAFTLGAALMDVGFGTNNSAKMEAWFDDLTTWDEKAESHWLGSFAKIATNLGVPGAYGFKAGERLARNALLAKRNGNYFKITDPTLQEKFKTSLNAKGRLLATLGGAAGVGATDAIFVGDPEGVGTFGDMIGAGPTELDPNDANLASKEIANRVRFGVDGALFLGLIGGTGSAVKSLARRRNELESNNDAIDKFFSVFRPRGKKSQAFFDMERQNIGARAGDINFAGEQARKLDKHIDAIFPFVKNPFNKLGNKGRSEFMDKLNDTLLSGEIRMDPSGKVNFGPMDEKLINEVRRIMKSKNAKKEDIDGVFDSFEQMRLGWGHIFSRLGYSMDDAARTEFKELFGNKFKSYLGSTYEIFQNKSLLPFLRYKPTEEAVEKTIKLFMDSASEAGKPISRGEAELFVNRAIETVKMPRDISTSKEKTTGIYFDAPEFFANKTVLDEIELGKKTVAFDDLAADSKKIMAELFGKVSDPMQTMLTGTNRLSLIGRRNQFFNDLVQADDVLIPKREEFLKANPGASLPKELKGFFRETEAEAVEAFGGNIKKIEIDPSRTIEAGITNPVNGKYAERGVAEALEEASQVAADKSTLQQMYESFILYPKATSQLAKTVLSPITHVRNFVSAGAFATANGLIPGLVSPEDFGRAFKEAFGQLQIPGARMDNERYRELLRLGVVNSNVRLGDLQRLLKDTNFGESVNSRKALRELMRPFSKFKKFTEDMYTAEDDFWKLTSFALERQRLGRAYEKYGIAKTAKELDEEAADIIRNNIPNYDMVNDFIKATRKLPLGNFVSFPAEIMRTTANILNRSLKEINFEHTLSDGRIVKPLQGIGYKRLFGMGTTVVGVPYATSEAFKAIYDVTEDEMQALRRFVPDWSKNSTILPIRGDDGKLKYIDFSHANAYDTMIRPINSMIIGVQRGVEEGELAKEVLKSMYEGTKETLSPFFSESIWTNALSDIVIRNGRTREGRRLYTDQTPWGERVNKSLLHLAETQFPGSIASFQRLDLAFEPVDILKKGKFDEYGNTFNIPDEALGFIGMRAVEVDPVKAMKFKIADFRTGINNARREFTSPLLRGGPVTPQQIAERYQIASEALYNVQEKMFRDYFAAMELGSSVGQLDREFADRVSKVQLNAIKRGEFKPFIPSENIEEAFAENARAIGQPNPYIQARQFIRNLIRLYDGVPFGVGLPNVRNPFRVDRSLPIQNSPAFQGLGQGLTSSLPTAPTGGALPNQTQTALAGQRVFGATDPIFGVG